MGEKVASALERSREREGLGVDTGLVGFKQLEERLQISVGGGLINRDPDIAVAEVAQVDVGLAGLLDHPGAVCAP